MCRACTHSTGPRRCDTGPISRAALDRRIANRTYRSDLSERILDTTGDKALARSVRSASMSSLPQIVEAAGIDPGSVSDGIPMPGTVGNHEVPDKDVALAKAIADAVGPAAQESSADEVVSLINDPAWHTRSRELRSQWRTAQARRAEIDDAAKNTVDSAAGLMVGATEVPARGKGGYYPLECGVSDVTEDGAVSWTPYGDLSEISPDERVVVAQSLLASCAELQGDPANCSGKLERKTQNAIKALEPDGEELLQSYRDGDMTPEQAQSLAQRLDSESASIVADEGKQLTKKQSGDKEKLSMAAEEMRSRADAATFVPVDVADIYTDPHSVDALYDFDPALLNENRVLEPEQARAAAAALLLSASNDASDARQDAALSDLMARQEYEAEEDRLAQQLAKMIPSGNVNFDYPDTTLGQASTLAEVEEGSAEWMNLRNTGIGGSEILDAMEVNPSVLKSGELSQMNDRDKQFWLAGAAAKKAHTYTEDEADRSTTGAAARGHAWEPALRAAYAAQHPEVEVACGKQTWKGRDGEDSYQTVNVDGILRDPDTGEPEGLLECKNSDVPDKWVDGVPIGYRAQVLSYLDATGLKYADLVARVDGDVATYRINADDPVSGVEGTKTFADYKPRVVANWDKIRAAKPAIAAAESEARASGASDTAVAEAISAANPYTPSTRRPIGEGSYDIGVASKNLEGLGIGTREQLSREIKDAQEQGTSVDAAVRRILDTRFDRTKMGRVVGVDGETAAAVDAGDGSFSDPRAFSPLYSDWIESGFVHQDADGSKSEKVSIMHGADQRILDSNGTGAEDVHGITPEMIADAPKLSDPSARRKVHKALVDGDVVVAHNVSFEQKHLFHHIPALKHTTKWMDTAWLARHFMPHTVNGRARNGKLETFSEDNGVEYRNAHRAAEDADMMIDAMDAFFARGKWWETIPDRPDAG